MLVEVPKQSSSDSLLSQQIPELASTLFAHQYVDEDPIQDNHC